MMENFFIPYQADERVPGERVGILAPHPDDEVFGPGGTLAKWHHKVVSVAVVTDGLGWGNRDDLLITRECESKQACSLMKWPEPEFWQFPDGHLAEHESSLVDRIFKWIELNQIDSLFVPSVWEMHRDHRVCAESALDAADKAKNLKDVWLYEIGRPLQRVNCLVDITKVFELKKKAMYQYTSQLEMQNYFDQITALNIYRTYTLSKECAAAEAFYVLSHSQIASFISEENPHKLTRELFS